MPAPVVAANTPHLTGTTVTNPFVLSRPQGSIRAEGVLRHFDHAGEAADALRAGDVTALTGALPFDPDTPAALVEPGLLWRSDKPWRSIPTSDLPECGVEQRLPGEDEHVARVRTALHRLRDDADPLRKVVLARMLRLRSHGRLDPESLLQSLIANDPAGNGYCVDLSAAGPGSAGQWLVGSSPEVLIRKQGRAISCHPLAGSARRLDDPLADWESGRALGESAKNLDEHRFVVDAIRDSLAPLCTELEIPERPTLTHTPQLWHLGTPIRGVLADTSVTALDLAMTVHPTPAICGTPTRAAFETISALEGDRGFYAGAVGWCDERGDGEWMVTIRCARIDADGTGLTAYAGGGIVADSVPEDELAETATKFTTILDALGVTA
ncbi:isochorismate synthase [Rhodococcus sp. OK519]|uniref:isochorismate synthase n=1 Tax=Rhodococcus sp. OK519 TaxID=2135729 RepID=UPI000D348F38|nr:isochorismate synthase [Rhodococcus sp. OK519]